MSNLLKHNHFWLPELHAPNKISLFHVRGVIFFIGAVPSVSIFGGEIFLRELTRALRWGVS